MNEDSQTTYTGVNYKLKKYQTRADKLKGHSGITVWAPQGSDDRDPSKYIFPNEKKFQEIDKAFWPGAQSGSKDDIDPSRLSQVDQERYNKLELELITVPTKDKREVEAKMEKIWQNHIKREAEKKMKSKKESLDEAKKKKKRCDKCYGYGCHYCGYRGYLFAPFYGKGDGTSAAAITTGPGGASGGGPAFPGAGGINSPGVGGGANTGMGPAMASHSFDGNSLLDDIDVIGRIIEGNKE